MSQPVLLEVLGEVTVPSGTVLVIDTGLLDLWCHDRPPIMSPGGYGDKTARAANSGRDFRIEGPDAERAGRAFDRQSNPFDLYDVPTHVLDELEQSFAECVRAHGLNAELVPLEQRVPHRERVSLALQTGGGCGEVFFFGVWGCVLSGLPTDRALRVVGERMPEDTSSGRWRWVGLLCAVGATVARSDRVGTVAVDKARLMFADADAIGAWRHDEPLDGLADFVFWGRDAAAAAEAVGAEDLGDEQWGWRDLPVEEAARRGLEVEERNEEHGWKMATDFRPHSHHYLVMRQVRSSVTDSGTVEVGGAKMCTFMTSWGDGVYPVFRDLDAEGRLVRVRIDLGNETIVARQQRLEELHFGVFAQLAIVSQRILQDGAPVGRLYREEGLDEHDSGWWILAGDESEEYLDDSDNTEVLPLRDVLKYDAQLEELLRAPVGATFRRAEPDGPLVPEEDED